MRRIIYIAANKSTLIMKVYLFPIFLLSILFIFSTCKKESDPCEFVVCENNGVCDSGICDCPDGYAGNDCSEVLQPIDVTISHMEILHFPTTNNSGYGWDWNDGPDLLLEIKNGNTVFWVSDVIMNADTNSVYDINNLPDFDFTEEYSVKLYDEDADEAVDDAMGGAQIIFLSEPNTQWYSFPEWRISTSGGFAIKYYFYYEWE